EPVVGAETSIGGVADHVAAVRRHEHGEPTPLALCDPLGPIAGIDGDVVPDRRGVQHGIVVDGGDGFAVCRACVPHLHKCPPGYRARSPAREIVGRARTRMDRMSAGTAWMERHQVVLSFGALSFGAAVGVGLPNIAGAAAAGVNPVLGLLLYTTFLGVPFSWLRTSLRDGRFLLTLAVLNFAVVPAVAWAVTRLIMGERALLVGALFVLLVPCIDYVIVFAGLAGGSASRLVAAAPQLMVSQMIMLPIYLRL